MNLPTTAAALLLVDVAALSLIVQGRIAGDALDVETCAQPSPSQAVLAA